VTEVYTSYQLSLITSEKRSLSTEKASSLSPLPHSEIVARKLAELKAEIETEIGKKVNFPNQQVLDSIRNGVSRYTWKGNPHSWWNLYGEEAYEIRGKSKSVFLDCLSYGVKYSELIEITPDQMLEIADKNGHYSIVRDNKGMPIKLIPFRESLIEAIQSSLLLVA